MYTFSFTAQPDFEFLDEFAATFGAEVFADHLVLPAAMGEGSIRQIRFSEQCRFVIHRYTLNQDLLIKRLAAGAQQDVVSIIFHSTSVVRSDNGDANAGQRIQSAGIRLAYGDNSSEVKFPVGSEIFFSVIAISVKEFTDLVGPQARRSLLSTAKRDGTSYFYYQNMRPEIDRLIRELATSDEHGALGNLYFRVKVYELIYLTVRALLNRDTGIPQSLASEDMEKLFRIRSKILHDLSVSPRLPELAHDHGLNETKMKVLFRQVFGDTIYNYFQTARMEQAAHLLHLPDQSVADVGYAMGFANLSHFSRLFKRHYGMTPKKFSLAG